MRIFLSFIMLQVTDSNACNFVILSMLCRRAVDDAYLWNPSLLSAALGLQTEQKSSEPVDLTSDDHKEVMDLTSDEDHTSTSRRSSHVKAAQCFDSAAYVDICGVSLPRKQRTFQSISQPSSSGARASELAMVESTQKNLHDVALAISEVKYLCIFLIDGISNIVHVPLSLMNKHVYNMEAGAYTYRNAQTSDVLDSLSLAVHMRACMRAGWYQQRHRVVTT